MDDLTARLAAAVGSSYAVEREVGRGATALVFLAHDLKHDRRIALKVLRPDLAAVLGSERFVREIQIAARLSHPHILPLHDSGAADGFLYYVMPFVEGQSLRDRLTSEPQLPLTDALRITREVADALGYAHDHDVVHRDIKPENILLAGGHAVVADFGIARAITAAGGERLTGTGAAVGTPAYMSPEQISNGTLDGRTDIYSLGCVLYEMLIGEPPFTGTSGRAVMARHSLEKVPSLRTVRDTIPPALEQAVLKALAKTPADRYNTASQFADALSSPELASLSLETAAPDNFRRSRRVGTVAAAGALVVVTALLLWPRLGRLRTPILAPDLVAVLPFHAAGSRDSMIPALSADMVELLYQRLPGEGGLRAVYPGTVAAALERLGLSSAKSLSEGDGLRVASAVGAGTALLGQIWSVGNRVTLSASLLRVPNGSVLARVRTLTGPRDSLVPLLDQLTAELLLRRAGESETQVAALVREPLPALQKYLAGRAAFAHGEFSAASRLFHEALLADTTFALAALGMASAGEFLADTNEDVGLARAWASRDRLSVADRKYLTAMVGPGYPEVGPTVEWLRAWEDAVAAAPDRMEPWFQLGEALFHWGPWLGIPGVRERAAGAFRRVLEIDPAFAPAMGHLLDIAAANDDTGAVRRLSARYFAIDSLGDLADYYRWRTGVSLSDRRFLARFRRDLDQMGTATLERMISVAQLDGVAMEDAVLAARALQRKSGLQRDAYWAYTKLREIALNRGRPAEAAALGRMRAEAVGVRSLDGLTEVVESVFWGADTTTAARVVKERASFMRAHPDSGGSALYDACAVSLWMAARGQLATLPGAIARLRRGPRASQDRQMTNISICADVLEAQLAAGRRRSDAVVALGRLDSLMRTGPNAITWILTAANLTVARLSEAQGNIRQALAATRRRAYVTDLGEPRVLVALSTCLREEGRLAAMAGEREAAIKAYRHFLALRSDPEPSVAGEVAAVRAELASLEARSR